MAAADAALRPVAAAADRDARHAPDADHADRVAARLGAAVAARADDRRDAAAVDCDCHAVVVALDDVVVDAADAVAAESAAPAIPAAEPRPASPALRHSHHLPAA